MNKTKSIKSNFNSQIKRNYKSRITRRIVFQYILSLVVFIAAIPPLLMAAYSFMRGFTWTPDDPFYQVVQFIYEYILLFLGLFVIGGWAVITYYFMGRPLRYLDEVIAASEQLAHPSEEQIILSDAMKQIQDEMNHVRETALLNAQLAKEAEQRKNDLIVYLAHDLKTPLTSVIGYLTLLRDEKQISEPLREKYVSISLEKAEHLEHLINEFFDITRFNLSHITLQYSTINLTRLFEQLIFEFQPMFAEKQLQCRLNMPSDLMLRCDADRMQRVFDNLLRNAVFYSFEQSTVEITVQQNDRETIIRFLNHGNTIPPEKLEHIFEQFFRLDTSRNSGTGGAGLGLAIAKEIVGLHGGTITAESEKEQITFHITLPSSGRTTGSSSAASVLPDSIFDRSAPGCSDHAL